MSTSSNANGTVARTSRITARASSQRWQPGLEYRTTDATADRIRTDAGHHGRPGTAPAPAGRRSRGVRRALPALRGSGLRPGVPGHPPAEPGPGRGPRRLPGLVAGPRGLRSRAGDLPDLLPVAGAPPGGGPGPAGTAPAGQEREGGEPRAARWRRPCGRGRRGRLPGRSATRGPRSAYRASRGTTTGTRDGVFRRQDPGADRGGAPDPARHGQNPDPRGASEAPRRPPGGIVTDDHAAIDELLAGYVLGALSGPDAAEMDRLFVEHIPGCDTCRATLRTFQELTGDLAISVDEVTPPDMLLPRLQRDLGPRRTRRMPSWSGGRIAATVAAVVVAVGVA